MLVTVCAGCAAYKRPLIHALTQDFILVKQGEVITAPKQGAFMSDYFLCKVLAVDVEGADYCKDVK